MNDVCEKVADTLATTSWERPSTVMLTFAASWATFLLLAGGRYVRTAAAGSGFVLGAHLMSSVVPSDDACERVIGFHLVGGITFAILAKQLVHYAVGLIGAAGFGTTGHMLLTPSLKAVSLQVIPASAVAPGVIAVSSLLGACLVHGWARVTLRVLAIVLGATILVWVVHQSNVVGTVSPPIAVGMWVCFAGAGAYAQFRNTTPSSEQQQSPSPQSPS